MTVQFNQLLMCSSFRWSVLVPARSKAPACTTFAIFFLAATLLVATANGSSTISRSSLSPVPNFEASWAASTTHGTTVAVEYHSTDNNDNSTSGIVILLRSRPTFSPDKKQVKTAGSIMVDGLTIKPMSRVASPRSSDRWCRLGNNILCCMTGLASDVDHLYSVLEYHVDTNRIIYEGSSIMSTAKIVEILAEYLQEESQSTNGRPFGVQCLLLGTSSTSTMRMYTLEPSGGIRYWGGATAIGNSAQKIRGELSKALRSSPPCSAKEALQTARNATETAFSTAPVAKYEALLVWKQGDSIFMGQIETLNE